MKTITTHKAVQLPNFAPNAGSQPRLQKDSVPLPALANGLLYTEDQGPWSMCAGEITSEVVRGGSLLMQWLPTRGVDTTAEHVAHLSFVIPENYTGAESYGQLLAGLPPQPDCGYGPSFDWSGFEYRHEGACASVKTQTLQPHHFGGRYCESQPIARVRGPNTGINLENDAQWAIARAAMGMEQHLNWNLIFGDRSLYQYTYDGLDTIIQPGFVQNNIVGPNPAVFADPLVINGAGFTTPEQVLNAIKGMVRKFRMRALERGVRLTANDMAIVMSPSHWTYLADAIAMGLLMPQSIVPSSYSVSITPELVLRNRETVTAGFFGFGAIPIDGDPVPVIPETLLASNVTIGASTPGVTGDIFILTRYYGGQTILEHQYRDWRQFQNGYPDRDVFYEQNGMLRVGWVEEASKCYYYFTEMCGRIVPRFMPLQGRINDVTVQTILTNENESGHFASQDFYAFGGVPGHQGTDLISGLIV